MNEIENKYKAPKNFSEDEKLIWQVLIYRDFVAFCSKDWSLISKDFIEKDFFGIDGKKSSSINDWSLTYPTLQSYKEDWIKQSIDFNKKQFVSDPLTILFNTTVLRKIEIIGNIALVHKEFNGAFIVKNENPIQLNWMSLFVLRKVDNEWKIQNFTGYLPRT